MSGSRGSCSRSRTICWNRLVFAKLYFDYGGLVLAFDDGRPAGFAHAGFGPQPAASWISTDMGVTCMVLVRPDCTETEVAAGLLDHCEEYLRRRGARVLYGGGAEPLNPFYVGLYGGSELPGVLDSDTVAREVFAARGYQEVERTSLLRRDLSGFESPVDRRQMQVRRQTMVEVTADAPTRTWWEACTIGGFDLTRFDLVPRDGGPPIASATFRSMEPSGTVTVSRAAGLVAACGGRGLPAPRSGPVPLERGLLPVSPSGDHARGRPDALQQCRRVGNVSEAWLSAGGRRRGVEEGCRRVGGTRRVPPRGLRTRRVRATSYAAFLSRFFSRGSFQRRCSHQYWSGVRRMSSSKRRGIPLRQFVDRAQ